MTDDEILGGIMTAMVSTFGLLTDELSRTGAVDKERLSALIRRDAFQAQETDPDYDPARVDLRLMRLIADRVEQ